MDEFDHLDAYERGVVARALLERLIKQGRLQELPDDEDDFEIVIPVSRLELQLLARFSDEGGRQAS